MGSIKNKKKYKFPTITSNYSAKGKREDAKSGCRAGRPNNTLAATRLRNPGDVRKGAVTAPSVKVFSKRFRGRCGFGDGISTLKIGSEHLLVIRFSRAAQVPHERFGVLADNLQNTRLEEKHPKRLQIIVF